LSAGDLFKKQVWARGTSIDCAGEAGAGAFFKALYSVRSERKLIGSKPQKCGLRHKTSTQSNPLKAIQPAKIEPNCNDGTKNTAQGNFRTATTRFSAASRFSVGC
jgi:hypothetical protein